LDPTWFGEVTIMSEQLTPQSAVTKMPKRYRKTQIIEHLASQYVLGTLTPQVRQGVEKQATYNDALARRIHYWQARFVSLDKQTAELPPSEHVWQNITNALNITAVGTSQDCEKQQKDKSKLNWAQSFTDLMKSWFSSPVTSYASAFSVLMLCVIVFFISKPFDQQTDPLSYVAVLTEQDGQAHLVATTYGESKKLIVNVVGTPAINNEQSLELWVVSKTDFEARSLGVLPSNDKLIEQQLTTAQWRLIKDSQSLLVTIEELGGSAIGEPSDVIVSRGLCVRLKEWKQDV